jgi:hypothetical protein
MVKHVTAQFDRYCHVVTALPHESIRLVANIVESELSQTPYDNIKQRLVALSPTLGFPEGREAVPDAGS